MLIYRIFCVYAKAVPVTTVPQLDVSRSPQASLESYTEYARGSGSVLPPLLPTRVQVECRLKPGFATLLLLLEL